jgi:hypothetical protein
MIQTKALQTVGRLAGALLTAAGLALSVGCGLDVVGTLSCDIANVQVSGTPTRHIYAFDFTCNAPEYNGKIKGAYDTESRRVEEKVQNTNGTLTAVWTCPSDPWLSAQVRCQRGAVQANYKNKADVPPDLQFGTYGSFKLNEGQRALLRARVAELKPPPPPQTPPEAPKAPAPAPKPTKPDLQVTRVSGPTALFDGMTAVYEVALWNDGTPATGTAQILLGFLGSMEAWEMVNTPAGFTCNRGGTGFTCTGSLGGVDDPVQTRSAVFTVQGHAKAKGAGGVYGSANHDRTLDEVTVDNNLKKLDVTVK